MGLALGSALLGSVNYYRNLLTAISTLESRQIEPVLLTGANADAGVLAGLPPVEVIRTRWLDPLRPGWALRKFAQQTLAIDPLMQRFLRSHRIDVLSHADFLGRHSSLPTICWIGDFQHRLLPHFFTKAERLYRDRDFRLQCRHATRILLSSHDAQRALAEFEPCCVEKSRVLQFVAQPNLDPGVPGISALEKRYAFVGPYFHVPNQFWAHKNHRLIVDALAILKARGERVLVISTGATEDYRQPEYFGGLMAHAGTLSVLDSFRTLGVVPYPDLVGLMVNAIALLNPSRAEGWSTSVEEAKSIGKRIVLSDIPVHREQAPRDGVYVDPDDPASLADAMLEVRQAFDPDVEGERMALAASELPARVRRFGEAYQSIVLEVAPRAAADRVRAALPESSPFPVSRCPRCGGEVRSFNGGWRCVACQWASSESEGVLILLSDASLAEHDELDHSNGHKAAQAAHFDREDDEAFEIDRPHGTPRLYRFLLREKFRRAVSPIRADLAAASALTVCGGSGMDAEFLASAGATVATSDLSLGAAKRASARSAKRSLGIASVVADVEHLPFADRSVDLVAVHDGLHHLADPAAGLAEMARVARRWVVITEPARASVTRLAIRLGLACETEEAGNRVERMDPVEVRGFLEARGFIVLRAERYAMYYPHRPGRVFALLSAPGIFPLVRLGWRVANALIGRWGNKMVVVAARSEPAQNS